MAPKAGQVRGKGRGLSCHGVKGEPTALDTVEIIKTLCFEVIIVEYNELYKKMFHIWYFFVRPQMLGNIRT